MVRPMRFSEAWRYGEGYCVECDSCGVVFDLLQGSWIKRWKDGELYQGTTLCWKCNGGNEG